MNFETIYTPYLKSIFCIEFYGAVKKCRKCRLDGVFVEKPAARRLTKTTKNTENRFFGDKFSTTNLVVR